jgi:hypothetical protein
LFPLSNSIRKGELKEVSKNSASLTQLTPIPSLLKKERGDMYYSTYYYSPSLIHLERADITPSFLTFYLLFLALLRTILL